jgi:hypothetical protein
LEEEEKWRTRLDVLLEPLRWRKLSEERPMEDGFYLVGEPGWPADLWWWSSYDGGCWPYSLEGCPHTHWRPLLESARGKHD